MVDWGLVPQSSTPVMAASSALAAHLTPSSADPRVAFAPAPVRTASVFAQPLVPILTTIAVAVLVMLALAGPPSADVLVPLWAAGPVAAAIWLRTGEGTSYDLSFGGLMAVGIFAGEILSGKGLVLSAFFVVANMTEIVSAVLLARRFAPTLSLGSVAQAGRFLLIVAAIAPLLAAAFAAGGLAAMHDADAFLTFKTWWFGHALGFAVVTPLVLSLSWRHLPAMRDARRLVEVVGLFGLLVGLAAAVHLRMNLPIAYLTVPVLIAIAIRLRVVGFTAALVVLAIMTMVGVISGVGPSSQVDLSLGDRVVLAQLWLLLGCLPILLVAALLDERDTLSEQARQGQIRAERASQAKSRLLANVAHEIKSPVGGVIGIGEMWAGGQLGPVTDEQREMARLMVKTAREVEALSHELLDMARAEAGAIRVELCSVDVGGVIEDVRRSIALRADAQRLRLEIVLAGDNLVAMADSQRLAQVIDNLATNAVKYGASGGVVTFSASRHDDKIRIEVTDRGIGLSADKQAQLFEPFNRLGLERSAVEGHGIGLALARRLVELMGGTIGVRSIQGQGATFWVQLPAA